VVTTARRAAAALILVGVLLGQVEVQRGRIRLDAVRLRDVPAVGLALIAVTVGLAVVLVTARLAVVTAADRDRGTAVRRAELQRRRQPDRCLLVLRRLADRLNRDPAAACLLLIGVLLSRPSRTAV